MTKNQSLFFRSVLFIAGAGIIVLAFFLSKGDRVLAPKDAFVWVSIGLIYLVVFLPFFFSSINVTNFSGKIPRLSLIWPGILLYIIASAVLIVLVLTGVPLKAAVVAQAILLFLFSIAVYFAYFASSHVNSVAAEENKLRQFTGEIKSKTQVLSILVNSLPAEYEKAQKILTRTFETIKYIYPVNGGAGDELELKILRSLNVLSELCGSITTGAHTAVLESEAVNLQALVTERKLLRN